MGKRIHGRFSIGIAYDRIPARDCRAYLKDLETDEIIPLWWRSLTSPSQVVQNVTLSNGEGADLLLFVREYDQYSKFFIYRPEDGSTSKAVIVNDDLRYDSSMDFELIINDLNGTKRLKAKIEMKKNHNNKLAIKINKGRSENF